MIQNTPFNFQNYNKNHINLIKKTNNINFKNGFCSNVSSDKISFTGQVKLVSFNDFLRRTIGSLSCEDIKKIDLNADIISKRYKNDQEKLVGLVKAQQEQMLLLLKKLGIKSEKTEQGLKFTDNIEELDKNSRNKIKQNYMNLLGVKGGLGKLKQTDPLLNNPSIGDWFSNIEHQSKVPNFFNSLYVHPVDKVKIFISDFTKEQQKFITKKVQHIKKQNASPLSLEVKKQNFLKNIECIFKTSPFNSKGYFTNNELKRLRKYSLQYEIFNKALGKNAIFSKDVESVISNSNKKLSTANIGEYIEDVGLVVQKTKVYDKNKGDYSPCLVIFNKEEIDYSFKLLKIDLEHEKMVGELKKEVDSIKNTFKDRANVKLQNQIHEVEKLAKTILASEKDMNISNVYFNVVPIGHLRSYLVEMNQPEKVENLIKEITSKNNGVNKVALVINLLNPDAKRYYEGGRKVALPLIHLLQEKNCSNIFMQAFAQIEGRKAPVPLYLRAGFKPISHTEEEIAKATENHKFWDPKIPVYMYLPEESMVNELVKQQKPLQSIFEYKKIYMK